MLDFRRFQNQRLFKDFDWNKTRDGNVDFVSENIHRRA